MRKGLLTLSKRDFRVIKFLWKWKVATTAGIAFQFFPARAFITCYARLRKLEKAGYIDQIVIRRDSSRHYYWVVSKKGFHAIRDDIEGLKEDGFKSEHIEHDWLVSAFHLGNWARNSPNGVRFFSEQQLRRLSPELYPDWVPKSLKHRADGYWGVGPEKEIKSVAIEVELNIKDEASYFTATSFYADQEVVSRVVWVVRGGYFITKVRECARKASKSRHDIHNFVLEEDFRENSWEAKIIVGPDSGRSVSELLNSLLRPQQNMAETSLKFISRFPFLDTRICLGTSGTKPILPIPAPN
jgi:hypothetical protein